MFRPVRRIKNRISDEECIELLKTEPRGVLSVLGDDGYPYGVPMDFWYDEDNGRIYFHSGKAGHKLDALKACDKVSFCVYDKGFRRDGEWALNIKSVIVFGRIKVVEDHDTAMEKIRNFGFKYTSDTQYIEHELVVSGPAVLCLELTPEHITGKIVNES